MTIADLKREVLACQTPIFSRKVLEYDNSAHHDEQNGFQDCISGQSFSGGSTAYADGWLSGVQFLADRLAQ